jgi:hypothetical protein
MLLDGDDMPDAADVLGNLTAIANDALAAAALWHAIIVGALVALWLGWRPSTRSSATIPIGLAASVSVVSFAYGNPFNGATFALLAGVLGRVAHRLGREPVSVATSWPASVGAVLAAYGLVYPHFLEGAPLALYAIAAPVGLIPCPTLSVMIGVTLMMKGGFSRAWGATLAGFGLFYALFGLIRLHVWLDAGLLSGALALALLVVTTRTNPGVTATPWEDRLPDERARSTTRARSTRGSRSRR